jgi:polyketide biosynthesis enoyl-CoA hydratase PksH
MPGAERGRLRLVVRDGAGEARLTAEVVAELVAALRGVDATQVVSMEGSGGAFCLGLHLDQVAPRIESEPESFVALALDRFGELLDEVARCPRPVIALVDGAAMGGGLGLCAAADVVLATPRSCFGLPEALIGLLPALAFGPTARRIGVSRARLLAMGGPTLGAEDAHRMGLVDEIVDDLQAAAARHVERFARMDARSIAAVKRLVADHFPYGPGYVSAARTEVMRLAKSGETARRLRRFLEGEAPWMKTTMTATAAAEEAS